MNRNRIFWGVVLILAGSLLFVDRTNIFRFNVWNLFWPLVIILIGGWIIVKNFSPGKVLENEQIRFPADQIESARVNLKHGAGRLNLSGGTDFQNLFEGYFWGGLEISDRKNGNDLSLELKPAVDVFRNSSGFPGHEGLKWDVSFNERINYQFFLKTGAGENHLDFRNLKVSKIDLETGASATSIVLPENSLLTDLSINAGAASVEIVVPDEVAAEIKMKSGLSGTHIDLNRFTQVGTDLYRSRDFDSAINKARIEINGGIGSFTVR